MSHEGGQRPAVRKNAEWHSACTILGSAGRIGGSLRLACRQFGDGCLSTTAGKEFVRARHRQAKSRSPTLRHEEDTSCVIALAVRISPNFPTWIFPPPPNRRAAAS